MTETKRRGRPTTQTSSQVCERLLMVAENCLQDKLLSDITVREIAAKADVNAAMIGYYFNNKEGLFIALIDFLFTSWKEQIWALVEELKTNGHEHKNPTHELVKLLDDTFYRHAPVINLLSKEIAQQKSNIQKAYRNRLASGPTKAVAYFIEQNIELGFYRESIDCHYMPLVFTSMAVHPITLKTSTLKEAYGIDVEELRSEKWLCFLEDSLDRLWAV